jgi:hypothetical protein
MEVATGSTNNGMREPVSSNWDLKTTEEINKQVVFSMTKWSSTFLSWRETAGKIQTWLPHLVTYYSNTFRNDCNKKHEISKKYLKLDWLCPSVAVCPDDDQILIFQEKLEHKNYYDI